MSRREQSALTVFAEGYTFVYMNITARTRVQQWGNSIGVRLSARVAARAGITKDTEIAVEARENSIRLFPIKKESKRLIRRPLKALLKKVRARLTKEDREWLEMKPAGEEI